MCGVVGYCGSNNAVPVLLGGLSRLEYRGYDSAGIAIIDEKIKIKKAKGKLVNLENKIDKDKFKSNTGIGHTRWATHGIPSDTNSHPHISGSGKLAIVHNGIIENFMEIKDELISKGYEFLSETDTEAVAHLLEAYYEEGMDLFDAIYKVLDRIEGAYAICIVCEDYKDQIICVRKEAPLIIGRGEGENFIASDMAAILDKTREIIFLEDDEVAVVKKDEINIYDTKKNLVNRETTHIDLDVTMAEKGGYDHFMIKEIYEQPKVVQDTISKRLLEDKVVLDNINLSKEEIAKYNKAHIIACGTAYYAGLVGKFFIEKLTGIEVSAYMASEYRYNPPKIDDKTLVLIISQSGETADTLAGLRLAKAKGARILSLVNVLGSSIARDSHNVFYTLAGPEISVASTKAYTSQVVALYLIGLHIAVELGTINSGEYKEYKREIERMPKLIQETLSRENKVKEVADKYINSKNVFFIGRGLDYLACLEGSLKLKEIAYLHAEAYPAGELKHGPIALLEDVSCIVGLVTQENIYDKTVSNLLECRARGAKIIAIAMDEKDEVKNCSDEQLFIPRTNWAVAPIIANVYQQLFAYYVSKGKGYDVDKPRNLAKSVTVE